MSQKDVISLTQTAKLFLAALAAVLLLAAPASARSTQDVFFEAPRDPTPRGATAETRDAAIAELQSLGVKAIRVNLPWADVAPGSGDAAKPAFDATDPAAYAWGNYGATIDAATSRGWKVLISPSAPVPKWATAAKADQVTRPSPEEFRLFTAAAAKRFGGPAVLWSIWNEPNLPRFLMPQVSGGKPVAGRLYRDLFIAGKAGIADGGQGAAPVLFGETAPSGASNDGRRKPLAFLRDALCLNSKYKVADKSCGKLSFSGWAHHPYQFSGRIANKDDVTYSVISRLTTALDKAAKAGAILSKRPVYMTEFGIQSYPDKIYGVSEQEQLERRARVERDAYFNSRIRGFSQYLLTDDDPFKSGFNEYAGFETGLRTHTGKAKKALKGFALVLDAKPVGKTKLSLWGLVRPATGKVNVVIERKTGKKFARFKTVKTNARGAFTATDTQRKGAQYRFRWTSPGGKQTSPHVRILKD